MPASVHVVLVARSSPGSAIRLERTVSAIHAQTAPVSGITIVVCGDPAPLRAAIDQAGVRRVLTTGESTTFAAAAEMALARVPDGRAVWLLSDATVPEDDALAALDAALERQPSVAIAAPKLVRTGDRRMLESFGVTMTASGRAVELAHAEYDQGQHDAADDVLGADIRGMLIRADAREGLMPDRALMGADEGLDLGVRARLGGRRLALAPNARVAVWVPRQFSITRSYVSRVARLHRRLVYSPIWALPLVWLTLLPLALWNTAVALVQKRPGRVAPEWMAAVTAFVRVPAIVRSRARIRHVRTGSWRQVDPLRIGYAEVREREIAAEEHAPRVREPLRFFSGGGAWAVIAAATVGIAAFIALLTWPAMAGGALLPLRRTVAGLWRDATWGLRAEGLGEVGATDPFAAIVAVLGSLWPASPSYALVLLWLAAMPLAVLGAWFAATRFANGADARVAIAVLWGIAPPLWDGLMEGRPAAVIAHLALPWAVYAAAAAHRSWPAAGTASLLIAATLASAPSLAPAIVIVWIVGIVLAFSWRRASVGRIVWLMIPSFALFAPLAFEQIQRGTPLAIFADPGVAASSGAASPLVAAGFADGQAAAWARFLTDLGLDSFARFGAWSAVLLVPVVALALAAPLTGRGKPVLIALTAAALGVVTAVIQPHLVVTYAGGVHHGVWPGTGLSLAWFGMIAAAAVALESGSLRPWRGLTATVAIACVALAVVPQLTALHRGATPLHAGVGTTLPAYISAEARDDRSVGTLILEPLDQGVSARVVWGASETLGGQSTLDRTHLAMRESDETLAVLAADIISGSATSVNDDLRGLGLSFVLLRDNPAAAGPVQRAMSLTAQSSMDARAGFVRVGETERGVLWRVDDAIAEREGLDGADASIAWMIGGGQAAIVLAAILLGFPTRDTRRASRQWPRSVVSSPEDD
ncbi:glycosyltransferase [Microbacterium amylolyticum]|uniref:GT2 family glycosyltransferase n=1 Tax=Microbacterium amylolyticum TaxID=936337 RepID=A0ABS4ZK55_9MICO|nr:glycosyltransferase [Microbacterium amylolyticum]MBP2437582.1 GT2 family glycosyltransferase [Microbacterium amylolyticum]